MSRKELIGTILFMYVWCPTMAFILISLVAVFK
ncbi:hypothetical protein SAMN05421868_1744 [Paenibacillus naphthalenovorans]|nr:hypothetical protein SAMN05421868_1744 [Paenibacillus naphthalenovorans]